MWPSRRNKFKLQLIRKPINFLNFSILRPSLHPLSGALFFGTKIIEFSTNMLDSKFISRASKADECSVECCCHLQANTHTQGPSGGTEWVRKMSLDVVGLCRKCFGDNFWTHTHLICICFYSIHSKQE